MDEIKKELLNTLTFPSGKQLPCRLVPGPMDGITYGSFVKVLSQNNWTTSWWTPFVRISTAVPRSSRLKRFLQPFLDSKLPFIAQLMGTDSEKLAEAAYRFHELGAICVDLNCACPSPKVLRNQGGGTCLKNPQWIKNTVLAMRKTCGNAAISVKIRAGFASAEELPHIAQALNDCQPDLITMHYRTVAELYKPIDEGLQRLQQARELLKNITLFGSGDIFSPEDALNMKKICKVDGVVAARGLLKNPALLKNMQETCKNEKLTELTYKNKLEFLRDIAIYDEKENNPNNGFLLKMTAALIGKNNQTFTELMKKKKIKESRKFLEELINNP